jgi:hypothetical protein
MYRVLGIANLALVKLRFRRITRLLPQDATAFSGVRYDPKREHHLFGEVKSPRPTEIVVFLSFSGLRAIPECAGLNRHVVGDARALQERK